MERKELIRHLEANGSRNLHQLDPQPRSFPEIIVRSARKLAVMG